MVTATATAAALLVAPSATAATTGDDTPADDTGLAYTTVKIGGDNYCEFTGKGDATEMVDLGDNYHTFRANTMTAVRASMPNLASTFTRADELTGTGTTATNGSLASPELREITTTVIAAMTERGYHANEVGYALWFVPTGVANVALAGQEEKDLQWLPSVNQKEAERLATLPTTDPQSVSAQAARFFHAAAALRSALGVLGDDASIALLNRIDNKQLLALLSATKLITSLSPVTLETSARDVIRRCVLGLRATNFTDGTASSKLSSDPLAGTGSSDTDQQHHGTQPTGDLSSGSSELSSGNGTSTVSEITEIFEGGSSKDNRKLGLVVMLISVIGVIASGAMRFAPVIRALNEAVAQARAKAEKEKQDNAAGTPGPAAPAPAAG